MAAVCASIRHRLARCSGTPDSFTSSELTASVYTGALALALALALAAAGVLAGKRATTHHGAFDRLPELDPRITVVRDARYVQDGSVWTSGGISAGIDMSLAIVRHLAGDATPVVEEMEWMWPAEGAARA